MRIVMGQTMVFTLNNQSVRFTPDGKVSVVDAIRIVTNSNSPGAIWDTIKAEHPEVLMHCEDYLFQIEGPISVVNSEGWETIWMLLPNYLSGMNSS
jgi:hypothetical protein